ncbi:Multidrug export protein MepA [Methanimicrococcus hongohii]|uniref:Multidrug export protein MepA n=1 Tax=Methanimicrococcus hongohii TaxID=3028295 RepID=A0AA96ZUL2_9EURY|nr:MATE family efflux transporter [Methanimicrococcus sp. Hf6]WNY24441.1 Multidrug export protein MepA [Methanimicrococcus sp. Hf6]
MSDVRNELLTQNPWKLMIKLSLPAILGQFVVGFYAFIDSIFVGQMVGVDAMSAVSAASPFVLINNGIAVLIGIGSGSILARAIGSKDQETVNKIMGNLVVLSLLLSALSMLVVIPLAPWLLGLTGAEGAVLEMGVSYLRTVFLGSVFVNFMQSANMIMRAEGRMNTAMLIMASGAILNIILDPLFIIMMPDKGPQAVAIATVVAQFFQAAVTLYYFLKVSPIVKFNGIKLAPKLIPQIFSVGSSAMLMQVMMIVQMTVLYHTAVKYGGPDQIALMGAAQRILQLTFVPLWGMSQAMQPAVGTNYGAKNYDRVKKLTTVFILGSTILATAFFILIQMFPGFLLSAFITDPAIVASGISNFRLMYAIFPTYGLLIMTITYFQSLGKGKEAGLIVMLRQVFLIVPLILILPYFMGLTGVWAALPVNDAIILILAVALMIKEFRLLDRKKAAEASEAAAV